MVNKCHKCEYYDNIKNSDNGLCKRFPPVLSVTADFVYFDNNNIIDNRRPMMDKNDMCGEYKEKV